jgi:hypothetical protein
MNFGPLAVFGSVSKTMARTLIMAQSLMRGPPRSRSLMLSADVARTRCMV